MAIVLLTPLCNVCFLGTFALEFSFSKDPLRVSCGL